MKNTERNNRFLLFLLVLLCFFFITSCSIKEKTLENIDNLSHTEFPDELKGFLIGKDVYFTSIGQSSEYSSFIKSILEKNFEIDYMANNMLESSTVSEGSVVFLFIGGSVKTMAELDTSLQKEVNRLEGFINLKNQGKIELICLHLGGIRRRGTTSDNLINKAFSNSNFNIYIEEGNNDCLLSTLSTSNNIPCHSIQRVAEMKSEMVLLLGESVEE